MEIADSKNRDLAFLYSGFDAKLNVHLAFNICRDVWNKLMAPWHKTLLSLVECKIQCVMQYYGDYC